MNSVHSFLIPSQPDVISIALCLRVSIYIKYNIKLYPPSLPLPKLCSKPLSIPPPSPNLYESHPYNIPIFLTLLGISIHYFFWFLHSSYLQNTLYFYTKDFIQFKFEYLGSDVLEWQIFDNFRIVIAVRLNQYNEDDFILWYLVWTAYQSSRKF